MENSDSNPGLKEFHVTLVMSSKKSLQTNIINRKELENFYKKKIPFMLPMQFQKFWSKT